MTKEEALRRIDHLIDTGIPVHPQYARTLYKIAELPIPDHLNPKVLTDAEKTLAQEAVRQIEAAFLEGMDKPAALQLAEGRGAAITNWTLKPGSDEAKAAGCWCPVDDNRHGQGPLGYGEGAFWITEGCPLHAPAHSKPEEHPAQLPLVAYSAFEIFYITSVLNFGRAIDACLKTPTPERRD